VSAAVVEKAVEADKVERKKRAPKTTSPGANATMVSPAPANVVPATQTAVPTPTPSAPTTTADAPPANANDGKSGTSEAQNQVQNPTQPPANLFIAQICSGTPSNAGSKTLARLLIDLNKAGHPVRLESFHVNATTDETFANACNLAIAKMLLEVPPKGKIKPAVF